MKKTFLKYKRLLVVFSVFFISLMFMSTYKIEYSFVAPGYNDDISSFITVQDALDTGVTFHTTSVIVVREITLVQYLLGTWGNTVTVTEFPNYYHNIDLNDLTIMGYLMKNDSFTNATIVGVRGTGDSLLYERYLTVYLTYDFLTPNSLEIGDKIVEINGNTELQEELDNLTCGELVEFDIIRGEEELNLSVMNTEQEDGSCLIGLRLDYFSEIISMSKSIWIKDTDTGGPSGGLMQSLYIYYSLEESSFEEGLRIGGTGTIDVDGNVGYIGAVKQKVITAAKNGMDIFFVPHLNDEPNDDYIEALEIYETLNTDMILVGVKTFDEAVEFLNDYSGGENND